MEANPTGATTLEGATQRLSSLLVAEQSGLPTETDSELQEATETSENTEEVETPALEETSESSDTEAPELYKVKVGEEELEVSLDDLRKGYMMESDYRKKTATVAEQRKTLEGRQTEVVELLDKAKPMLEFEISQLDTPEMQELKSDNPEAYLAERDKVEAKVKAFNQLQDKADALRKANLQQQTAKERELLTTKIPEWLDSDVMNKESTKVLGALESMGYTKDEMEELTDHRVLALARKAMLFDEIGKQDLESKKVKTPPKVVSPNATEQLTQDDHKLKDLKKTLRETGRRGDAQNLIKQMLKG